MVFLNEGRRNFKEIITFAKVLALKNATSKRFAFYFPEFLYKNSDLFTELNKLLYHE